MPFPYNASAVASPKTPSVRGRSAIAKHAAPQLLLIGMTLAAVAGCGHTGRPAVHLRLSGAQIPTEMTASWLDDARGRGFTIEKVWPLNYSQSGFSKLAAGTCDLACTDRRLSSTELEQFGDRRVRGHRIAFYGFGLYVHLDNPLDAIFAGHLELVLREQITDWQQLAGDAVDWQGPIQVYGRAKDTRAGMHLSHMARILIAEPTWEVKPTDQAVIAAVADDPRALGFANIGYDDADVRYLGLRMERTGPAAYPSLEEIESERYGLAKLIYVYHIEPPTPAVQAALDYLRSEVGAAAIRDTDMWPVDPPRSALPAVP